MTLTYTYEYLQTTVVKKSQTTISKQTFAIRAIMILWLQFAFNNHTSC